jgi:hypothetical protein
MIGVIARGPSQRPCSNPGFGATFSACAAVGATNATVATARTSPNLSFNISGLSSFETI